MNAARAMGNSLDTQFISDLINFLIGSDGIVREEILETLEQY